MGVGDFMCIFASKIAQGESNEKGKSIFFIFIASRSLSYPIICDVREIVHCGTM